MLRASQQRGRQGGFTMFEVIVTIITIVILYMVAEERLNELPAAAERANFFGVLEQIKTGVSFEMVTRLASGHGSEIQGLEGRNPMDFLVETPSNYRGELAEVTDAVDRRGAWYFETSTGELVYVVGAASIGDVEVKVAGQMVNLGQIRLKLMNEYSQEEPEADQDRTERGRAEPDGTQRRNGSAPESLHWEALLLKEVAEYKWERRPETPVPL